MGGRDIIVVGASAGGVDALRVLCRGLPAELRAALFVVMHTAPDSPGLLARILERDSALRVMRAEDRTPISMGTVYVAPPDRHLLVERDLVRVVRGPRENRHRPGIDPLFRSAAAAYGPRVAGVVLTGYLDDGSAGLQAIKRAGGIAIVQDPAEAPFAGMPTSALDRVSVDHCVRIAELGPLLTRIVSNGAQGGPAPGGADTQLRLEAHMDTGERHEPADLDLIGRRSAFTCPQCSGALWEVDDSGLLRFRCHVGHTYSDDSLAADQEIDRERALWTAIRAIEEQLALQQRMAERARGQGLDAAAVRFEARHEERLRDVEVLRRMLMRTRDPDPANDEPAGRTTAE